MVDGSQGFYVVGGFNSVRDCVVLNCSSGLYWCGEGNDFTGSRVLAYLRVFVRGMMDVPLYQFYREFPVDFPACGAEVEVVCGGVVVYATPRYGGVNATADSMGYTPWILVQLGAFEGTTFKSNPVTVKVYYEGVEQTKTREYNNIYRRIVYEETTVSFTISHPYTDLLRLTALFLSYLQLHAMTTISVFSDTLLIAGLVSLCAYVILRLIKRRTWTRRPRT